jgi:CRP-like cAMP-binding protein
VRGLHISRETFEVFLTAHPRAALKIYRLFSEKLADRVRALSLA